MTKKSRRTRVCRFCGNTGNGPRGKGLYEDPPVDGKRKWICVACLKPRADAMWAKLLTMLNNQEQ